MARNTSDLWASRPVLEHIRDYALSRHVSPFGVLGVCLVRSLLSVPPYVTLPGTIGGQVALNPFLALVSASGGGKGACERCGAAALASPELDAVSTMPIGSGEGAARSFARRGSGENSSGTGGPCSSRLAKWTR